MSFKIKHYQVLKKVISKEVADFICDYFLLKRKVTRKLGDVLHRHKDRSSCEISTTINLGGEPWPIYLEPDVNVGHLDENDNYVPGTNKGVKVDLEPGDMLMYKGCILEHWREAFKGENCVQVFLHYNDASGPNSTDNIYDKRPFLGLPGDFREL